MNKRYWLLGSIAGGLVALVATTPAQAAKTAVDGYYYELPAGAAQNNLEAVRALIKASDAHGLTRNNGTGANCLACTIPSFELKGAGMYNGIADAEVLIDFDYRFQAIRADVTRKSDKARTITVAARGLVWDETTPGIFNKAGATPPLERLWPAYILPSQVVYAGAVAADKVVLGTEGGKRTLTVPVPEYMTTIKATLDDKYFIVATELKFGGKTYTGEYSAIETDHMDNHVFLPHRVIQKVDGKVVNDLTLEYHWSNPYMLFRPPAELAQK
jgi:hypothetical protein